jgi:hypothetical protein
MSRRLLGDTLVDVAVGAAGAAAEAPSLIVNTLTVSLPIELALGWTGNEWELRGAVPRTLTRTAFDLEPARLEVVWTRGDMS